MPRIWLACLGIVLLGFNSQSVAAQTQFEWMVPKPGNSSTPLTAPEPDPVSADSKTAEHSTKIPLTMNRDSESSTNNPQTDSVEKGDDLSQPVVVAVESNPPTPEVNQEVLTENQKHKLFADRFWNYLLANNYKHWSPPAGKPADFFKIEELNKRPSVHGKLQKIYVNRIVNEAMRRDDAPVRELKPDQSMFPVGSIVVMENYNFDKSLDSISVMYRSDGFNPKANDWFWVQYNPDGTVAFVEPDGESAQNEQTFVKAVKPRRMVGRAATCIRCHQGAETRDLVYFSSPNSPSKPTRTAQNSSLYSIRR